MTYVAVPTALVKNTTFKTQISTTFEKGRLYSPFTTIVRADSKYIDVPSLSVSEAKSHSLENMTSVGTATLGNQTITIDTKSDNSINYLESNFNSDEFGFKQKIKAQLLRTINRKVNSNFATNILAGATSIATAVDLSTAAAVNSFMSDCETFAHRNEFSWMPSVEHGKVEDAKYLGEPFVMCGSAAFKAIQIQFDAYMLTATGMATRNSGSFRSPTGVWIIDASGDLETLQTIHGIAGAPLHAYREDNIIEVDREIVSRTVAGAISGDLVATDETIQADRNMSAGVWEKALLPTATAAYVNKQLATV